MSALNSATLDKLARLIAQGHGPMEAARRAGRRAIPRSSAERKASPPSDVEQDDLGDSPRNRWRTLSNEEWLAEYGHLRLREEARSGG